MTNPTNEHREQAREIARCAFHGGDLPMIDGQTIASTSSNPETVLVDYIEAALSSRDSQIREVLERLQKQPHSKPPCWCWVTWTTGEHDGPCKAARKLYKKAGGSL